MEVQTPQRSTCHLHHGEFHKVIKWRARYFLLIIANFSSHIASWLTDLDSFFRADEMDEDDRDSRGGTVEKFVLPTAPRAARGPDMSDERIPRDPPFTAYIANLSYDADVEVVRKILFHRKYH